MLRVRHDPDAWLTAPEQLATIVGDHVRCGAVSTVRSIVAAKPLARAGHSIRVVLLIGLALGLTGCGGEGERQVGPSTAGEQQFWPSLAGERQVRPSMEAAARNSRLTWVI